MSNINHPSHYNSNGLETIFKIQHSLTKIEFLGGIKFNILKYLDRCNHKHTIKIFPRLFKFFNQKKIREDLNKALWYTNYAINILKVNSDCSLNVSFYEQSYEEIKQQIFLLLEQNDFYTTKSLIEYLIENAAIFFDYS